MKIALIEPFSGIAGDMTIAAFLDLGMPMEALREGLAGLPLEGYTISAEKVERRGFAATRFSVEIEETHPHRTLADVSAIIEKADLPDRVIRRSLGIFENLAMTEAAAHGTEPDQVHFHEVGAVDAIVDIVGTCIALEHYGIDDVLVTRIRVGTGETVCRHGRIPIPAPATMRLLTGFPISMAEGDGEIVTPTGASILAALARPVRPEDPLVLEWTGFGAGSRDDTSLPNVLRVSIGDRKAPAGGDRVVEIRANVDDMSAESLAFAAERLRDSGGLDVWMTPVTMKKGRPGVVISVLSYPAEVARVEEVLFRETSTFGVRRTVMERTILDREHRRVETPWGEVRVKIGLRSGEALTVSPEYEDCARLAEEKGVPLKSVFDAARAAAQ